MKDKLLKDHKAIIIAAIITLIVLIYSSTFIQPKIKFSAEITTVGDEDYKRIINNDQIKSGDKSQERFKHVDIKIKVSEFKGIVKDVSIERDQLRMYLERNPNIIQLGGGGAQGHDGKEIENNTEIYLSNISEEDLKETLKDFKVKVKWIHLWHGNDEKIFYLKDYLK